MMRTESLIELPSNASKLLDRERAFWSVQSGSVAVFSVTIEHDRQVGPREYLMTCTIGDTLFGALPQPVETEHGIKSRGLLVVGLEHSQLVERSFSTARLHQDADWLRQGVADWVRKLSGLFLGSESQLVTIPKLESGNYQLREGISMRVPRDQVGLVRVHSGKLLLHNLSELAIGPSQSWMPLSGNLVLTAAQDSHVEFNENCIPEDVQQLGTGIQALHSLCLVYLEIQQRNARIQQATRLARRNDLQSRDTAAAIGEMNSALTNISMKRLDGDLLSDVLDDLGRRLDIQFLAENIPPIGSFEARIRQCCHRSRIRLRRVRLRSDWLRQDAGPLLGLLRSDDTIDGNQRDSGNEAVVPVVLFFSSGRYFVYDLRSHSPERLNGNREKRLLRDAFTFVRPMPEDANSLLTLGQFLLKLAFPEMSLVLALSLAFTILGMLIPVSTRLVIDDAIPDADTPLLAQLAIGLLAMTFGQAALSFARSNLLLRASTLTTSALQAAVIDRLMRLPTRFFRDYSSGDLQNRSMMISEISHSVGYAAIGGILTGGLAALNLLLCYTYSPTLALIALCSALIIAGYTTVLSLGIRKTARVLSLSHGKLFGLQVQLITGVGKLQVAGAEQRAFNFWARQQAKLLVMINSIQRAEQWGTLVNSAMNSCATIVLYYFAITLLVSNSLTASLQQTSTTMLTVGAFLAFYVAFQTVIQGATGLSATLVDVCDSWAKRKLVEPILEAELEDDASKVDPGILEGRIAVSDLSFRYSDHGPLILKEVNIQVAAGEFIAIVGASGSGKSTLLRLLLGFENPQAGAICFDGQDFSSVDRRAVRRQIGAVLQSGRVNAGSIYENIAGPAKVSLEETWVAAASAGLAEDIQAMPMGMHTFINEGGSTLSGGQRQRLLIARALVTKPKILIFDEATSALDNRTQKMVSESLDRLQVTRIVVAHRLSTIRDADRIYVMGDGRIIQVGSFEQLANQEGYFKQMIARQMT